MAEVHGVAFSPDGKILAAASGVNIPPTVPGEVKLWDVATRREVATLKGHQGAVWSVAFSPDGRTLATGSWDGTLKLWDVASRRAVTNRRVNRMTIFSLAFSP